MSTQQPSVLGQAGKFSTNDGQVVTWVDLISDLITEGTTNLFLTPDERIKLNVTSNTNSGDETVTTIKSKLGVTTLSGSNTGDQDLGPYATISSVTTGLATKQDTLISGTNIRTINGNSLLGNTDLVISGGGSSTWGAITGTLSNQTDLNTALRLRAGKNYTFLVGSTADCDYIYNGTDIGVAINAAIAALAGVGGGGVIQIKEGIYTLATSINLSTKSNVTIKGTSLTNTRINVTGEGIIMNNANSASTRFKNSISDLFLSGNSINTAIQYDYCSDLTFMNIVIDNFAVGIKARGLSLYNKFWNIKIQNTILNLDFNETVIEEYPTAHGFFGCKFLEGTTGVRLSKGNQIEFFGCEVENFQTHLDWIACLGCSFIGGRLENTNPLTTAVLINLGTNSANNLIDNPYIAAQNYISRDTHIIDNGEGNNIIAFNNYKDQFATYSRNLGSAADYVKYESISPGGTSTMMEVSNTYTPSGSPTIYKASAGRALAKLYSGNLLGIENFSVLATGLGYFAAGLNVNSQRIINVATPTANTDAVNKAYVDLNAGTGGFGISPANMGFLTFNYQPLPVVSSSDGFANGNAVVIKIPYTSIATITNAHIQVRIAGVTLTNSYVALYRDRVEIGKSADQSTAWTTTGLKTMALTETTAGSLTNVPLNTSKMLELVFWVGTAATRPQFARGDSTSFVNGLTTGTNLIFSLVGSPASTQYTSSISPTTAEMANRTTHNISYWVALS